MLLHFQRLLKSNMISSMIGQHDIDSIMNEAKIMWLSQLTKAY